MTRSGCVIIILVLSQLCLSSRSVPYDPHEHVIRDHKIPGMKVSNKFLTKSSQGGGNGSDENGSQFWVNGGLETLKKRLTVKEIKGVAKNVILFLGDGMSFPTLAAARIFKGQLSGNRGEESHLSFEKFPFTGLSKTYCVDSQVADSACSATAYLNAVKGNIMTIGVTGAVKYKDCDAMTKEEHHTSSIAKWAQTAGKATGLVTTTRVTHASPSGLYAHIADRDWENDQEVTNDGIDPEKCWDIARQLVQNEPGKNLRVILGGGRASFTPDTEKDPEYPNKSGCRADNKNLINEWLQDKKTRNLSASYVWNREELIKEESTDNNYILGLFEPSHMKYHMDANLSTEPTLEEMTKIAIKKLQKEKNGFFLFVEGGKIDLAHHSNFAKMALDETIEFSKAIQTAFDMTDYKDTLIVVTADHAHTMSFSGYPERGSDIITTLQDGDIDNLPYSTLGYANGPGYKQNITDPSMRYNLSQDTMNDKHYMFPTTLPLEWETHGGDDVAVFASGPWAHLLVGNYEQNVIPLVMAYATRIGPSADIPMSDDVNSSFSVKSSTCLVLIVIFLFILKHCT